MPGWEGRRKGKGPRSRRKRDSAGDPALTTPPRTAAPAPAPAPASAPHLRARTPTSAQSPTTHATPPTKSPTSSRGPPHLPSVEVVARAKARRQRFVCATALAVSPTDMASLGAGSSDLLVIFTARDGATMAADASFAMPSPSLDRGAVVLDPDVQRTLTPPHPSPVTPYRPMRVRIARYPSSLVRTARRIVLRAARPLPAATAAEAEALRVRASHLAGAALLERRCVTQGSVVSVAVGGLRIHLVVASCDPLPGTAAPPTPPTIELLHWETGEPFGRAPLPQVWAVAADGSSRAILSAPEAAAPAPAPAHSIPPRDSALNAPRIVGADVALGAVRQVVGAALRPPPAFARAGLSPPRGVLLHGAPGTGKTLLAAAVAHELGAALHRVSGGELMGAHVGDAEHAIRAAFAHAAAASPCVLLLDEVDAACPARDAGGATAATRRAAAALLTAMDGVTPRAPVAVVATTNRPHALDPALRRPGRLDVEVEVSPPTAADRALILRHHLSRLPLGTGVAAAAEEAAAAAHGYVGADLRAVAEEAAVSALRRAMTGSGDGPGDQRVSGGDVRAAFARVRPSALREVAVEVPAVRWSDVGGQEHAKAALREAVEWPLRRPDAFARMGIRPPKGVLLYGPPGCSKTLLAKALATEGGMNFLAVRGPELFSKWVGDSERAVRRVFARARRAAPSVVFFDEIDALAGRRGGDGSSASGVADRVLSQLLQELDGVSDRGAVVVVAATNRPDLLDEAMLRPGRFDRLHFVAPPNRAGREAVLRVHLRALPVPGVDALLPSLAARTPHFSGAELAALCREAALAAMARLDAAAAAGVEVVGGGTGDHVITAADFETALARARPQLTEGMMRFYADFAAARGGQAQEQ